MNNKELLPCPFTGEKPDLYIYDIGDWYEGKIAVDSIDLAIYFDGKDKEEVKEKLLNIWNNRVYPKESDTYILHPVTGERMDKSMCKRVITQMYEDDINTIKERDRYHEMADKLADSIANHFGIDIGEHSNMNCPWENALEWIYPITPEKRFDGFYYCTCGQKLENWDYCANCGQKLDWSEL